MVIIDICNTNVLAIHFIHVGVSLNWYSIILISIVITQDFSLYFIILLLTMESSFIILPSGSIITLNLVLLNVFRSILLALMAFSLLFHHFLFIL